MRSIQWHVGDVIRKLRLERGWTQTDLGDAAGGIRKMAIIAIEANTSDPRQSTVRALATALGVTLDELYALVPGPSVTTTRRRA